MFEIIKHNIIYKLIQGSIIGIVLVKCEDNLLYLKFCFLDIISLIRLVTAK